MEEVEGRKVCVWGHKRTLGVTSSFLWCRWRQEARDRELCACVWGGYQQQKAPTTYPASGYTRLPTTSEALKMLMIPFELLHLKYFSEMENIHTTQSASKANKLIWFLEMANRNIKGRIYLKLASKWKESKRCKILKQFSFRWTFSLNLRCLCLDNYWNGVHFKKAEELITNITFDITLGFTFLSLQKSDSTVLLCRNLFDNEFCFIIVIIIMMLTYLMFVQW